MKKLCALFLMLLISFSIFAQLNANHNSIRVGDVLVKQQVEYKDPLKAGVNLLWDFSQLKLIDEEYTLTYSEAPLLGDSLYIMGRNKFPKKVSKHVDLIVGTEHNTMYYFYQTRDSLLLLGYENAAIKQENILPIAALQYPFSYGQQLSSKYQTTGMYSGVTKVQSEGIKTIAADAFGMMILPSGDTISPVLRVKMEQTIHDITKDLVSTLEDDRGSLLKSYKWYSKGYRYPIFETVESIDLNTQNSLFATAFFFPPQDHLYLDTDPENLALLDKLWEYTEKDYNSFKDVDLFEGNSNNSNYKIYPNPVRDVLNIEYTLEKDTPVNIMMATIDGKVVKNIYNKQQQAGDQKEQIDCSHLTAGVYLLKIVMGEKVINEKIFKK